MCLRFACEARRGSSPRPFCERPETLFDKALARPLHGASTRRDLLRNFLIAEPFIGFQQDAGARDLSSRGLA